MPRNTKGGNKAKKGKNVQEKEFILKEDEQHYAKVTKVLGNCRFTVLSLEDNKTRVAHVRGNMRKRNWINNEDIVIITLRDFQDDKCDIVHVYTKEETKKIPMTSLQQETQEQECSFDFNEI